MFVRLLTLMLLLGSAFPANSYNDDGDLFSDPLVDINDLREDEKLEEVFYQTKTIGKERLIVIQTISQSKRTIVVRLGHAQGIRSGAKALFSTDKISVLMTAKEVSRNSSLWVVDDPGAIVPFEKGEYVVYNNSTESLFDQIPSLRKRLEAEIERRNFIPKPYWVLRGNGSVGVYESVSDISSNRVELRAGTQFELNNYYFFDRRIDWGWGLRGDIEIAVIESEPRLQIPTTRFLLTGEFLYHFPFFKTSISHFYAGLGLGIGPSITEVSDAISAGYAVSIPVMRLGLETRVSDDHTILAEIIAEGVSMQEKFDDGTLQTTNIANIKLSLGYKF